MPNAFFFSLGDPMHTLTTRFAVLNSTPATHSPSSQISNLKSCLPPFHLTPLLLILLFLFPLPPLSTLTNTPGESIMPTAAKSPTARPTPPPPTASTFAPPAYSLAAADRNRLLATEWLLTNGLGGFAMGTCSGVPARRYHGLLVAAASPPVGRIMALNATVDQLEVLPTNKPRQVVELSTFRFGSHEPVLHPRGIESLSTFEKSLGATWTSEAAGFRLTKSLHIFSGMNAASITFTLERINKDKAKDAPSARLNIRPLTALRDMHALTRRAHADRFESFAQADGKGVRVTLDGRTLYLQSDLARFTTEPQWWYDFFYQLDAERGQDCLEDLYSPGAFSLDLPADRSAIKFTIQASIDPIAILDRARDRTIRTERLSQMCAYSLNNDPSSALRSLGAHDGCQGLQPVVAASGSPAPWADDSARKTLSELISAADDFIVARRSPAPPQPDQTSIIAGYPWFADWGRDAAISLRGLMLATGRFDDAKKTLLAFASHRRNGIVPNLFNDQTGEPEYNTVDGSLWFILGACEYLERSGDRVSFDSHLAPACLDIITHYRRGTDFHIAMDPHDKLITAGTSATQLTWMDARRDGVTFTPRHGKAVEINALWCSALRSLATALTKSDPTASANLTDLANAAARSFASKFWNPAKSCLFDCLTPSDSGATWIPSDEIRPNQIFAVSLPHSPLSADQQRAVVACVREKLLTPFGLRTLDPSHPNFRPRYEGNLFERDRAYHNGTAWPWLLGPYAEAVARIGGSSASARSEARAALQPLLHAMHTPASGNCIGQIAEVYDATEPQRPQGCPAQAWSVGELLRVWLITA